MKGLAVFLCVFLCMTATMMGTAESGEIGSGAVDAQGPGTDAKNEGAPAKGGKRMCIGLGCLF
ncbi:hypothetical protein CHS0354_032454 [Potamilus streckersoni]|uniref:Uncharacterized protein n=1 Tax=Potamilus streckersoni TaxID=2493646 RepID=A0AAE0SQX1_9BIVA|nr:hypothetical protein CHS0354_032454 [Potamilus streckersoni]